MTKSYLGAHLVWNNSILRCRGTTYPYIDLNFGEKEFSGMKIPEKA
jgi:hypothetical protein